MASIEQNTPATAHKEVPDEKVKGFKLIDTTDGHVTICAVAGKPFFLNHGKNPVAFPDEKSMLPVATQEILKSVYDANPGYIKLVTAPYGYIAPWQKK